MANIKNIKNKPICIIPLRKGSKSIKHKNIKKICGKPLFFFCIKAALSSKIFDKIIIASDSQQYFKIIRKFFKSKKIIFFNRSKKSSKDNAKTEIVINEIFNKFKKIPENICLAQATSPLVNKLDFKKSYKIFISKNYDSLFSCYKKKSFIWKFKKNNFYSLNYNYKKRPMKQKSEFLYFENGAIFIFKKKNLKKYKNRLAGKIGVYIMPEERSIDIDEIDDFNKAQELLKKAN